jgi:DNA-binding beta-propeller fold protein YncE
MESLMTSRIIRLVAVGALAALAAGRSGAQGPAAYHVVQRVELGGEGGWDYLTVDTAAHRLYISRGTHVMVVDTDRHAVVGDIPDTPGVHGIAIAPALGRGFTTNGRDSTVTIFDTRTLAAVARVKVTGRNPDALLFEPTTSRVFTFNHSSGTVTALDAATGQVVGTADVGGTLEAGQSDGSRVFVNVEDRNEIGVVDARTMAVLARWPLAPCVAPTGMAIDRAHARLIVGCADSRMMAIVDYGTGKVVTTVPAGAGIDAAAFDPATQLAFAPAGDGTLTVAHEDAPDRFTVVATVPTLPRARTMALDERTHRVYTVSARFEAPGPATADNPRPRPTMVPGSFVLLVLDR